MGHGPQGPRERVRLFYPKFQCDHRIHVLDSRCISAEQYKERADMDKAKSTPPLDWAEPQTWPDDARRDRLIGDWYLYQRTGGHRTSTDDLITAWFAIHRHPEPPSRYLDLGCGIGSVLLMVSHKLQPTLAHGVEAQAQSWLMAQRAIAELPVPHNAIKVFHADFRLHALQAHSYDLLTASPPYFPLSAGVLPKDSQRRACRFEARGGVEAYLQAAAQAMSASGHCYLVFQTQWEQRVLAAAQSHKLFVTGQADFLMRRDRPQPFLSVYELAHQPAATPQHVSFAVRDSDGEISAEYQRLRLELGVA